MGRDWLIVGLCWSAMVIAVETFMARAEGVVHLLWFSHLGMLASVVLWWWPQRLAVSTLALTILLPELVWTLDFALGVAAGRSLTGATGYMWDARVDPDFRLLSLFHIPLPAIAWILLRRTGYDRRALATACACAAVVLPLGWWLGGEPYNLNWTWHFDGVAPPFPAPWQMLFVLLALPLAVYLPSHLALRAIDRRWPARRRGHLNSWRGRDRSRA